MTRAGAQQRSNSASGLGPPPLPVPGARVGLATRRRRPGLIGLAVLVVAGGGVAGARLYQTAGAKTPVVIAVRDVPAGHRLDRADLATTSLAGPVTAIAAANLDSLVGQTAAVHLVPGQLLNRAMLTDQPAIDRDHALVGLSLRPGQLPGDGLEPGDAVRLVLLPAPNAAPNPGPPPTGAVTAPVLVEAARVYAIRPDDAAADVMVVTLVVGVPDAPGVAAAGSAGQVGLIKVGG